MYPAASVVASKSRTAACGGWSWRKMAAAWPVRLRAAWPSTLAQSTLVPEPIWCRSARTADQHAVVAPTWTSRRRWYRLGTARPLAASARSRRSARRPPLAPTALRRAAAHRRRPAGRDAGTAAVLSSHDVDRQAEALGALDNELLGADSITSTGLTGPCELLHPFARYLNWLPILAGSRSWMSAGETGLTAPSTSTGMQPDQHGCITGTHTVAVLPPRATMSGRRSC
jgi:hypothetical protein